MTLYVTTDPCLSGEPIDITQDYRQLYTDSLEALGANVQYEYILTCDGEILREDPVLCDGDIIIVTSPKLKHLNHLKDKGVENIIPSIRTEDIELLESIFYICLEDDVFYTKPYITFLENSEHAAWWTDIHRLCEYVSWTKDIMQWFVSTHWFTVNAFKALCYKKQHHQVYVQAAIDKFDAETVTDIVTSQLPCTFEFLLDNLLVVNSEMILRYACQEIDVYKIAISHPKINLSEDMTHVKHIIETDSNDALFALVHCPKFDADKHGSVILDYAKYTHSFDMYSLITTLFHPCISISHLRENMDNPERFESLWFWYRHTCCMSDTDSLYWGAEEHIGVIMDKYPASHGI